MGSDVQQSAAAVVIGSLYWEKREKMDAVNLLFLFLARLTFALGSLPILCWHGVNDNANSCNSPISVAREEIPDLYAVKVQIGDDLAMDEANSILMRANDQVSFVCDLIANDPLLANGYNGIGISQGGLMLRGVVQRCPQPPMRNLATFGSPHQGVFGIPECEAGVGNVLLCELVRQLISLGAYEPWIQDLVAPAQYWHDPFNQTHFLSGSHYLADLNNEREWTLTGLGIRKTLSCHSLSNIWLANKK